MHNQQSTSPFRQAFARHLDAHPRLRDLVYPWAALTLCLSLYYAWSGLNIQPFRAESGVFIAWAWGDDRSQFLREYIFAAYNGHFTPLQFGAELLQARLFGASERLWFWRQMVLLGLLGAALAWLSRTVLQAMGNSRHVCLIAGYALALMFLLQPAVAELASWPFMSAQLLCLTCAAMGLLNLVRVCGLQRHEAAVWALAWSYASMHFLGLGIAISAAMLACIGVAAWCYRWPARRWRVVAVFAALTVLHGMAMAHSAQPSTLAVHFSTLVKRFGALYMGFAHGGLQALWASGRFRWPDVESFPIDAIYGLALLAAALTAAVVMAWRAREDRRPQLLLASVVAGFPALSLAIFSALPVLRSKGIADPHALDAYLYGTRYLIFAAFLLYLPISALAGQLARSIGGWMLTPLLVMALGSAAGTTAFIRFTLPGLWPHLAVPSAVLWSKVVDDVAVQLRTQGYVLDRPLPELDQDFKPPLHLYTPLLEYELGCTGCVRFEKR
ncbi:hypothetical protein O4D10_04190 [Xanthomonas citri pv. citri]|uniref:hypothetical protein n=1 Tax=Xanthomonas citri TaxID=346 RepID=UPI0036D7BE89